MFKYNKINFLRNTYLLNSYYDKLIKEDNL